jgi:serine/threonine protein kinase
MSASSTKPKTFLGKGSYGKVYRIRHQGRECAVKEMRTKKGRGLRYDSIREIILLKDLEKSHLVPKIRDIEMKNDKVRVIMDCYDTSLSKLLRSASLEERLLRLPKLHKFFIRLMQSLVEWNIQHLDIKPGNIVVDENGFRLRLIDFGFASYVRKWEEKETRKVATRWYRPPEYLFDSGPRVAFMCDAWCCGMSLLQFIRGKALWKPSDDDELKEHLCRVEKTRPISDKDFLHRLENQEKLKGSINVRRILGDLVDRIDEDILDSIQAMLSLDPRVRAKKLDLSPHDLDHYTPFLSSSNPIERMIGRKLYHCDNNAFEQAKKDLNLDSKEIASMEIDFLRKYVQWGLL